MSTAVWSEGGMNASELSEYLSLPEQEKRDTHRTGKRNAILKKYPAVNRALFIGMAALPEN